LIHGGKLVFAVGASVNVMQAGAGHSFLGHVVDGDCVLVVCGVLVALVGDFNESGGIDIEGKLVGLCAFLCHLGSFKGYGWSCRFRMKLLRGLRNVSSRHCIALWAGMSKETDTIWSGNNLDKK
jgi:hypothetical protein